MWSSFTKGTSAAPAAPLSLVLQLPGGERKLISVAAEGRGSDLVASAGRESGRTPGTFRLLLNGAPISAATSLLTVQNLSTIVLEPVAAPAPPAPAASTGKGAPAPMDSGECCAICLESFSGDYPPHPAGGCGHGFHAPCLVEWKGQSPYCPLCRGLMTGCSHPPPPQTPHSSLAQVGGSAPPPQQQQLYAPAQQQQQQQQRGVTTIIVQQGAQPYYAPAPPTVAELAIMLAATRARVRASPEWALLRSAVASPATRALVSAAGSLAVQAAAGVARGIAHASPGITGAFAAAALSAGASLYSAAGGGGGGGAVIDTSVRVCPQCRTTLHLPPGSSAAFRCGSCARVIQR